MELVLSTRMVPMLGIPAARWGFDSTERLNSAEWDRPHRWREGRGDGMGQKARASGCMAARGSKRDLVPPPRSAALPTVVRPPHPVDKASAL